VTSLDIFRHDENAEPFAAGQTIFEAGDRADRMYVVAAGAVEIRVGDIVVERVEPGGIFGEMALIEHLPRSATAVTIGETKLAPIDQRRFLFLVQNHPFFALEVMQVIAHRLRNMDDAMHHTLPR
jgi:CRP-like cAMP-binding protein